MECETIIRNADQKIFPDSSKRQRVGDDGMVQMNGPTFSGTSQYSGRSFIPILTSSNTYHTEDVKRDGDTLYKPLTDDTLLNVRNVEQITFGSGLFHIGNTNGAFERTSEGYTIMLWKYADSVNRLFVSRSILFTSRDEYWAVRCRLELM